MLVVSSDFVRPARKTPQRAPHLEHAVRRALTGCRFTSPQHECSVPRCSHASLAALPCSQGPETGQFPPVATGCFLAIHRAFPFAETARTLSVEGPRRRRSLRPSHCALHATAGKVTGGAMAAAAQCDVRGGGALASNRRSELTLMPTGRGPGPAARTLWHRPIPPATRGDAQGHSLRQPAVSECVAASIRWHE